MSNPELEAALERHNTWVRFGFTWACIVLLFVYISQVSLVSVDGLHDDILKAHGDRLMLETRIGNLEACLRQQGLTVPAWPEDLPPAWPPAPR